MPVDTYRLTGCPSGGGSKSYFLYTIPDYVTDYGNGTTMTSAKEVSGGSFYIAEGYTCNNVTVRPMIRVATNGDDTWTPYSNICPISGHTGVTVVQTGVNVWNEQWEVGSFNTTTGEPIAVTKQIRTKNLIPLKEGATYRIVSPSYVWCLFYDANVSLITDFPTTGYAVSNNARGIGTGKPATFTVPTNCRYVKFYTQISYGATYNNNISINYPNTDTAYHAYHGTTIPISWQSTAGTVYGGELDVVSGKLTVDRAMVDLGTLDWTAGTIGQQVPEHHASLDDAKQTANGTNFDGLSEKYKSIRFNAVANALYQIALRDNNKLYVTGTESPTGKLVYELAEPIEYTLTPQEVSTFLGTNNIWADTGDTEVTYRADIAKYIEKKVAS